MPDPLPRSLNMKDKKDRKGFTVHGVRFTVLHFIQDRPVSSENERR